MILINFRSRTVTSWTAVFTTSAFKKFVEPEFPCLSFKTKCCIQSYCDTMCCLLEMVSYPLSKYQCPSVRCRVSPGCVRNVALLILVQYSQSYPQCLWRLCQSQTSKAVWEFTDPDDSFSNHSTQFTPNSSRPTGISFADVPLTSTPIKSKQNSGIHEFSKWKFYV